MVTLREMRRGKGERLGVVAVALRTPVRQAYSDFSASVWDELALDAFFNALAPGSLQRHVRLSKVTSLSQAVEEAERAELILKDVRPTACYQVEPVSRSRAGGKRAQGPPVRDGVPRKANTLERELVVGRLGTGHGLWLKCTVQGVPVTALVDTGSTVSIIRPGALCLLRKNAAVTWDPTDTMLRSVTGERIKMGGKKRLCVGLAKRTLQHEFCLAPIRDACILGLDFLKALGTVLDIPAAALRLGRTRIPLAAPPTAEPDRAVATASVQARGQGPARPEQTPAEGEGVTPLPEKTTSQSTPEAVRELWHRSSEGLTEEQSQRLWALLQANLDAFAAREEDCTWTSLVQHQIDTGSTAPIRLRAHRLPIAKQQAAERKLKEMAESGVIEPSNSPWAAPVVLVKKKDGSWRFCVDYRRLNAATKADSYPLPRIDDALDKVAGSSWFSSLDLRSGYWQVELAPEAREKTAFTLGAGLWQFRVIAFGLRNAPATFERLMERVLAGIPKERCILYLDDLLAHAPTFDEALACLEQVIGAIKAANLRLHPKKCLLHQRKVQFLGHVVSGDGVATDPEKVQSVRRWPTPHDVSELRSFLGLASYYRRFIQGFADIAAPLHRLTEKGAAFQWTDGADKAFRQLRDVLCAAPVLTLPQVGGQFVVDTDASGCGIGAVLSQVQGGQERVIAYYSRALSKQERNYCVTRRELLAVVSGLRHFRHYLYGTPFVLRTDHASLTWLMQFKEPEGQVARWITALQEFQFVIRHRAGRLHSNADALSRRPCLEVECRYCARLEQREEQGEERVAAVGAADSELIESCGREEFQKAQGEDPVLRKVLQWKRGGHRPEWQDVTPHGPDLKAYRPSWDSLSEREGLLYRRWEDAVPDKIVWQLLVPRSLRRRVLQAVHGPVGVGHFGVNKTLRQLRQRFYWPGCRTDVELFVHCCDACTAKKGPTGKSRAPLQPLQSGAPMERVAVDVLGPFPRTEAGNRYVLVAMDFFTKWPEAYAVPDQSAVTTAERLVEEFFCHFGLPEELHSDQGRNFESQVMAEVCQRLGVRKTRTTPLHPQSDGLVERFNKTLATQLAILADKHQRDWDRHLPLVLWSCRAAVQESTSFTPAQLMLGRELCTPTDLVFGLPVGLDTPVSESCYARNLRERLAAVHRTARENQEGASARQKRAYDTRCQGAPLAPGTAVWFYNPRRKTGRCPKLQSDWEGPCRVLHRLLEVVYRVQTSRRTVVVHRDRLAPYRPKGNDMAEEPPGTLGGENSGGGQRRASTRARRTPPRLRDCIRD
ncbi:hypothetical protein SRHO_G00253020 [Serrasalmus rhombeus]